jgi:hypothetical protein
MNQISYSLSQLVFSQLFKTFDPYQPTIFAGPGYYFKYTPSNPLADDTSVVSLSSNSVSSVVFIYFNSTTDPSLKRITGNTFVFLNQAAALQLSLQIKKISFLGSNEDYVILLNNNVLSLSISSDSDGFVTISSITTSISSAINCYVVSSSTSTGSSNLSNSFAN